MGAPLRARWLGLQTLLGRGRGFLIPYRHAGAALPHPYPALEPLFLAAMPAMAATLALAGSFAPELAGFAGPAPEPRLDQDWFPRLDAAILYALVRDRHPRRVIEVGSGHSTRFIARAARDAGTPTDILCIDPRPRAALAGLPVRHLPRLLQAVEPSLFEELSAGDILFIDSSHVAMPGSDVDLLLNGVLPRLGAGVLVHIHDIFLPDPYPEVWAWRGYNEQVAVGALLQGGRYDILFASRYLASRAAGLLAASPLARLPLVAGAHECSLWLRVRG